MSAFTSSCVTPALSQKRSNFAAASTRRTTIFESKATTQPAVTIMTAANSCGRNCIIEAPYAAAAGADLNLRSARACMIIDLGVGTTDIAVISGGSVLHASTLRVGAGEMDRAITRYLHLERKLEVSDETAEEIKIELSAIEMKPEKRTITVRGRNLTTSLPEEITVASEEIYPLIQPTLRVIKQHICVAFENISTEASVDLLDSGVMLSGGLAQLSGLGEYLSQELGLSVRVASDPMLAAALGAGRLLEQESQTLTQEAIKERESSG